jgi:hypothetical protein
MISAETEGTQSFWGGTGGRGLASSIELELQIFSENFWNFRGVPSSGIDTCVKAAIRCGRYERLLCGEAV